MINNDAGISKKSKELIIQEFTLPCIKPYNTTLPQSEADLGAIYMFEKLVIWWDLKCRDLSCDGGPERVL